MKIFNQLYDYDCGAASFKMALGYFGIKNDYNYVLFLFGSDPQQGVPPERFIEVCKFIPELKAKIIHSDINSPYELVNLKKYLEKGVVIVDWWDRTDGHYSVLVDVTRDFVVLADPSYGKYRKVPIDWFYTNWFDYEENSGKRVFEDRLFILITKP